MQRALVSPTNFSIDADIEKANLKPYSGALLNCNTHHCPSKCHQVFNHSKMLCEEIVQQKCPKGHTIKSKCHENLPLKSCPKCEKEKRDAAKQAKKKLDEQLRQDEMSRKHQRELEKLQKDFDRVHQEIQDSQLRSEQEAVLAQKRQDLSNIRDRLIQIQSTPIVNKSASTNTSKPPARTASSPVILSGAPASTSGTPSPQPHAAQTQSPQKHKNVPKKLQTRVGQKASASKKEWQRQKDQENAINPAIDKIMEMIGLEDVKSQVLRIKAKVDTSKRQGTDLKKERLGLILLGNPGTGKCSFIRRVLSKTDCDPNSLNRVHSIFQKF